MQQIQPKTPEKSGKSATTFVNPLLAAARPSQAVSTPTSPFDLSAMTPRAASSYFESRTHTTPGGSTAISGFTIKDVAKIHADLLKEVSNQEIIDCITHYYVITLYVGLVK